MGSSPLTRGKLLQCLPQCEKQGLIPAHAGKTRPAGWRGKHQGAHPRSRGENWRWALIWARSAGSSPLTRGKRLLLGGQEQLRGLIPAHAGKTMGPSRRPRDVAAHPRSRGENHTGRWAGRGLQGSSPLTRGKLLVALAACDAGGLIPAHAGKTIAHLFSGPCARAHPRSRGENLRVFFVGIPGNGSSPLTRGKPRGRRARQGRGQAHPRSRGENNQPRSCAVLPGGSSPLTRGKR